MWETITGPILSYYMNDLLVRGIIVALVRCVAGYIENAMKKKEKFSFRKLGETFFRLVPQLMGWTIVGVPEMAFVTDVGLTAYKNKKK